MVIEDPVRTMSRNVTKFKVESLGNLMADIGHDWIDVLKVDIEGAEWPMLKGLLDSGSVLPFTQLQVEDLCRAGPKLQHFARRLTCDSLGHASSWECCWGRACS